MSKSDMDFQAIREKLLQQARQYAVATSDATPDWVIDPPADSAVTQPKVTPTAQQHQFISAVETLKQRSAQPTSSVLSGRQAPAASPPPVSNDAGQYRQQLLTMVEQINALSAQQEQVMQAMQAMLERLEWEHQRYRLEGASPQDLPFFTCDAQAAVVAWATEDDQGGLILSYRPVTFQQANQDAAQVAEQLRGLQQTRRGPSRRRRSTAETLGLATLFAEPLLAAQTGWHLLREAVRQWGAAAHASSAGKQHADRLTVLEAGMWLGGGILSRLFLNLILSAYPGLWSIAVAIITAITAYALYRATLAPRLEFGLAYRVLLAVIGLIIGGRF